MKVECVSCGYNYDPVAGGSCPVCGHVVSRKQSECMTAQDLINCIQDIVEGPQQAAEEAAEKILGAIRRER